MYQEPIPDKSPQASDGWMLAMFLILFLNSFFCTRVWHSLMTGRNFCMILAPSVNMVLLSRPSFTCMMAKTVVWEPPGQKLMRSLGIEWWRFSKNLNLCRFVSKTVVCITFVHYDGVTNTCIFYSMVQVLILHVKVLARFPMFDCRIFVKSFCWCCRVLVFGRISLFSIQIFSIRIKTIC